MMRVAGASVFGYFFRDCKNVTGPARQWSALAAKIKAHFVRPFAALRANGGVKCGQAPSASTLTLALSRLRERGQNRDGYETILWAAGTALSS